MRDFKRTEGPFDPNRLSEQEWIERGVSVRTARTIRNYLAKGGRFREAADLKKIWGMDPADCERLMSDVRITESNKSAWNRRKPYAERQRGYFPSDRNGSTRANWPRNFPARQKQLIDINGSDSVIWESLPGIGPGYARRIVRYRDRLGGFIEVNQIGETYQLPDSVFQRIRPLLQMHSDRAIRQIPINTVSIDTLGRHPYCGYSKARLILRYRDQHGAFTSLEDLLNIVTIDEAWLNRIRPYLKL